MVSRDGAARPVEAAHGKWHRITTTEEVVPGAVVALHPDWGRSAGVSGPECGSTRCGRRGWASFAMPGRPRRPQRGGRELCRCLAAQ